MNPGAYVTKDKLQKTLGGLTALTGMDVLVGIPAENTDRQNDPGAQITNAAIGYIMENGAPEANIPARPSLVPGVADAQPAITRYMEAAGKAALRGDAKAVEANMNGAGLVASASVKKKITEGIPPPLANATLRARARRGRTGAAKELANRAAGRSASTQFAKPLIDTGQFRNAVTYVIRKTAVQTTKKISGGIGRIGSNYTPTTWRK